MANPRGESNLIVWWIRTESNRDNDPRSGADATVTAVLRELKETEIKDKRADYEAGQMRRLESARCGWREIRRHLCRPAVGICWFRRAHGALRSPQGSP